MIKRLTTGLLLSFVVVMATASIANSRTLVELDEPYTGELKVVGFELTQDAVIEIDALGLMSRYSDNYLVYAWIIDHETREPVWEMKERRQRKSRRKATHEIETTEDFPAGKYELYLYAGDNHKGSFSFDGDLGSVFRIIDGVFDGRDDDDEDYEFIDDAVEETYVRLSSDKLTDSQFKTFEVSGDLSGTLLKYNRLGDSEYIETGFKMKKAGKLRIYSILEYPDQSREAADYGWIVNADTREKVWEIDRWNTDYAGGGEKNRMHDEDVEFEVGNYVLYFVTDDSHSFESFNVNPPTDPLNWGITILPGNSFNASDFGTYEIPTKGKPLIDFTKARNNKYYEEAFQLSKSTELQIFAIGELGNSKRSFADYGFIIDVSSGKIVWEMTRRNTEHAGGNDKNRLFDGTVTLNKGSYIASYVTDDTHAYRSFNASPPYQPKAYGMAIYPGAGFSKDSFKSVDIKDAGRADGLLVNMTRVRDNERKRQSFTLKEDSWVTIYALGEGTRGDMADYAWIMNDKTGRDSWEMTWRNTSHAGGARKNRVYDDDVYLEAGEYEVTFVTDGSHSFNDWNDDRPDDPFNYGIKISISNR